MSDLLHQARKLSLADSQAWRALLHYKPRLLSPGLKSLVDSKLFFNALTGQTEPTAELEATLGSFFSPANEKTPGQHPQCLFPARYAWLKGKLNFDGRRLPEQQCPHFKRWLSSFDTEQLSLVFASAYLNNPASMLGHTLLRIDGKGQKEGTRLLAMAANFAANTEDEIGIGFALKGIFGGYPGRFSITPYYRKVKEYADIQNRDLWEYRLNLSDQEVQRLLQHLWELKRVYFDYYFFDENCAYHLFSLLDAARPDLQLTDQFPLLVVPTDILGVVTTRSNLLSRPIFRPSRRTVMKERLRYMNKDQRRLAEEIALAEIAPGAAALTGLSNRDKARALELAKDYFAYRKDSGSSTESGDDNLFLDLLKARSKIDISDQTPAVQVPSTSPDQGHGSSRAGFTVGFEDPKRWYMQIEGRPAYHDLLDPEAGYRRGAQIQFLNLAFRLYPEYQRAAFERLNIIDVMSLAPWDRFLKPVSWKFSVGMLRKRLDSDSRSLIGRVNPAIGLSFEFADNAIVYGFAESFLEMGDDFKQFAAIGAGPSLGVVYDLSDKWRLNLFGQWQHTFTGHPSDSQSIMLGQRINLGEQSALRLDLSWEHIPGNSFLGAAVGLMYYF